MTIRTLSRKLARDAVDWALTSRNRRRLAQITPWLREAGWVRDADPVVQRVTRSGVWVIATDVGIAKIPLHHKAAESLRREHRALLALSRGAEGTLAALLPTPLDSREFDGHRWYLQRRLAGNPPTELLRTREADVVRSAVGALGMLARAASLTDLMTDSRVTGLIDRDVDELRRSFTGGSRRQLGLERRLDQLHAALQGQRVSVGWVHGDFWPGNLLVRAHEDSPRVELTGIVDWDRARQDDICLLDLINLVAYSGKIVHGRELGEEIAATVSIGRLGTANARLFDEYLEHHGQERTPRLIEAVALLFWLRFVAANLRRYPDRRADRRWMRRNVDVMLT